MTILKEKLYIVSPTVLAQQVDQIDDSKKNTEKVKRIKG